MFITAERIAAMEPRVDLVLAGALAAELDAQMPAYGITTLLDRAHFMAQAAYESEGFSRFSENLHYTHPAAITAVWPRLAGRAAALINNPVALANAAYAGRNGNGDEASGDGWALRGRGIFMLTGRNNYRRAGAALGVDYIANPDLVAQPKDACLTALWFWKGANLSALAEQDNCDAITRVINGPGMEGINARRMLVEMAKQRFT